MTALSLFPPHWLGGKGPIGVPMSWGEAVPARPGSAGRQHYNPQSSVPLISEDLPCADLYLILYLILHFFPFLGSFCYPSTFPSPPKQPVPYYFFSMGPRFGGFAITT